MGILLDKNKIKSENWEEECNTMIQQGYVVIVENNEVYWVR